MKYSESVKMMDGMAFCFTREYYENTGERPTVEMVEKYVKDRFQEYCDIEGIEYIEED